MHYNVLLLRGSRMCILNTLLIVKPDEMVIHTRSPSFNMLCLKGLLYLCALGMTNTKCRVKYCINSNNQLYIFTKSVKMLISNFCHFAGRRIKYQIQEVSHFLRNPFLVLFEIKPNKIYSDCFTEAYVSRSSSRTTGILISWLYEKCRKIEKRAACPKMKGKKNGEGIALYISRKKIHQI